MIKFYNGIQKYIHIQEENYITKFKHNLRSVLITKAYYYIKEFLEE